MTEVEWLACDDPGPMLWFVNQQASERKLRLFNCGCCRRVWHLLNVPPAHKTVETAEKVADGLLHYACIDPPSGISPELQQVFQAINAVKREQWPYEAAWKTLSAYRPDFGWAWQIIANRSDWSKRSANLEELRSQADLFRCVFGNPFRTVTIDPAWQTATVTSLAEAIYQERAFDRLPILADALEDAGCNHPDILNHCRSGGKHVRGCWLVDSVLGKE